MLGMIFAILFTHVFWDYYLQTREMAAKKSSELSFLFQHCILIWLGYIILTCTVFINTPGALAYPFIIAITHGIQDWYLWRFYKKRAAKKADLARRSWPEPKEFKYWEDSEFYLWIGIDSALHLFVALGLYLS